MVASPRPLPIINELILKEIKNYYTRYQVNTENQDKDTRPIIKKELKLVSLQPIIFGNIRDYYLALLRDYKIKKLDQTNKLARYYIIR